MSDKTFETQHDTPVTHCIIAVAVGYGDEPGTFNLAPGGVPSRDSWFKATVFNNYTDPYATKTAKGIESQLKILLDRDPKPLPKNPLPPISDAKVFFGWWDNEGTFHIAIMTRSETASGWRQAFKL